MSKVGLTSKQANRYRFHPMPDPLVSKQLREFTQAKIEKITVAVTRISRPNVQMAQDGRRICSQISSEVMKALPKRPPVKQETNRWFDPVPASRLSRDRGKRQRELSCVGCIIISNEEARCCIGLCYF